MKEFTVQLHEGDALEKMRVKKLKAEELDEAVAGSVRQLFELDTNIGLFLFVDGEDHSGNTHYLILRYEEEAAEEPADIFAFQLEDFYEMVALYLGQAYFDGEELQDGEVDGPIYHLVHLLAHVVDSGKEITS